MWYASRPLWSCGGANSGLRPGRDRHNKYDPASQRSPKVQKDSRLERGKVAGQSRAVDSRRDVGEQFVYLAQGPDDGGPSAFVGVIMAEITVTAESRGDFGKNASRRLRYRGMVPAVVYGGKGGSVSVSVDPKALQRVLHSEAGRNTILKLDIAGQWLTNAILKSWQVDPVKE